jgi:peptidyl-prolyl isomerase H (cyclophilin H)
MAGLIRAKENPVVFFDLHANKHKIGRVTFELFADICPKTAENFRQFCTGESLWNGKPAGYKETCLHRIVEDKFIEGGDFVTNGVNCKPKISIYGEDTLFED